MYREQLAEEVGLRNATQARAWAELSALKGTSCVEFVIVKQLHVRGKRKEGKKEKQGDLLSNPVGCSWLFCAEAALF